jgi:glycosyltransferase involved in cell wall biosynthesis
MGEGTVVGGGFINLANSSKKIRKIGMLGTYLPRMCGIATFTYDLSNAIAEQSLNTELFVLAVNDTEKNYLYSERVRFEISEGDLHSFRRASDYLNVNDFDVLCVQHEYGIFGGKAGSHVLALLRELKMPVVVTLHTILGEPNEAQRFVMDELGKISERLVVMTERGRETLQRLHGVPASKIDLIPHGIPRVPFDSQRKDELGLGGKSVLLTFGLLSPDKGIEYVIDALPGILAAHPNTIYVVLGATHPHVKEQQGEMYRLGLESRAKRLGVDGNIIFHNRFVSQLELVDFLSATDIYITPYLNMQQSTSGTLAYALGSGRAVISTPYWHAQELLADGRGILVPPRNSRAIADAVNEYLDDDEKRLAVRQRAAAAGREMLWPVVAQSYLESFERAKAEHVERLRTVFQAKTLATGPPNFPEVNLEHLRRMSDDTGLMQHAAFNVPRYHEGYCLDDNARALLLMTLMEDADMVKAKESRPLVSRYLAFVNHAFDPLQRRFRNFLTYSRQWVEENGSEECHARAIWALGCVVGRSNDPGCRSLSSDLFHAALPAVEQFSSPRAWAYALLGIAEYLRAFEGDSDTQAIQKRLAERLLGLFERSHSVEWPWFEDRLTYCNARLPQALIVSGSRMLNERMTEVGLKSLAWLSDLQRSQEDYFAPIGSNGFYVRGEAKADFDQQPVEACAMVSACLAATRVSTEARWTQDARRAFNWFLGENHLQHTIYDAASGGCRDGIHVGSVNENQGAESTLSFLMALTEMHSSIDLAFSQEIPRGAS